jgi:tetratricopeptide (TPR) repeat protein
VQPADLLAWRENLTKARNALSGRMRVPLMENPVLIPELERIERRVRSARGWRADALGTMLMRMEFGRHIDTTALLKIDKGSALQGRVLAARAIQNNLLGDHAAGLSDADAALSIKADDVLALEARAGAQLNLGKPEEALATLARIPAEGRSANISSMIGGVQQYLGRYAEAEVSMRQAVDNGSSELREFSLLWLFLAAEAQGGRGKAAVQPYLDNADGKKMSGAMLQHLVGNMDSAALLKLAGEKPELERLNTAEATFFIGQRLLVQGKREEALSWFKRTVQTGATPYREMTYAQLELTRIKP